MSKTRAEIVTMALENLQLVSAGQQPEDDDTDKVDGRFSTVMAELEALGIYTLPDEDEISDDVSGALAELLAIECAPIFGVQKDFGKREDAQSRLRVITMRSDPPSRYLRVEDMPNGVSVLTTTRWLRGGF